MPRPLSALPKAHLHLHLTGSMRHETLLDLAGDHGIRLPPALTQHWPPHLSGTDERGWFRFQRLYDSARSVLRAPHDVRRLLAETAQDERTEGSRWLEIQVDPDGYAARFGGITAVTELVLDAAARATAATGVGIGVIIAANRTKHPLEARTLARLAAQYVGHGVTGFGLSNDERRGPAHDFTRAFRIAERAGLLLAPHGGELLGPASVAACLDDLHADRIGHGVRAAEDPDLVKRLAAEGVTCEVCPSSNVALGIAAGPSRVPLRRLFEAGVPVALGTDDPLLFGPRLTAQYEIARNVHGFTDPELADLARASVLGSVAPEPLRTEMLTGIDRWLAENPLCRTSRGAPGPGSTPDRSAKNFAEYPGRRISLHAEHGDDPAITGEPPEERALGRKARARVEPGGSGPLQPADERSPGDVRRETCADTAASEVVPRCARAGAGVSSSQRWPAPPMRTYR